MGRTRKTTTTPGVVGYLRVSTEEQAVSGLGLAVQRTAIATECARRGMELLVVHIDAGISGKNLVRPGLTAALADLDAGRGAVLMVAKLDRLSRSVHDATGLLLRADRAGWGLIALDANVDTTTPQGAAMTQVLAVFAELERRLIGERTKAALAVKKAQGVKLGRPRVLPTEVVERIRAARAQGGSWSAIARDLNADATPTAQGGGKWYPATVRYVHESRAIAIG
ncbi:MAG TPA: recombinase family protein [Pseudonocardiaceae bacterium]|jgi:DNA invertase Pin-like site-specific DNA recombinase|nr:recombinase family protein [Pseudonocardiaceae bacterium]